MPPPPRCSKSGLLDILDAAADAADGANGALLRRLHLGDLYGDDVGGFGGLHLKRFDLGGDHAKAFAGGAGARRFDGGIERQQIGLPGDAVDELDDVVDLLRRHREAFDVRIGRLRFRRRRAHHVGGAGQLVIDLGDRFRHFLRRVGGDLDTLEGVARRLDRAGRVGRRVVGDRRQR
jgi:hypothetical protein